MRQAPYLLLCVGRHQPLVGLDFSPPVVAEHLGDVLLREVQGLTVLATDLLLVLALELLLALFDYDVLRTMY